MVDLELEDDPVEVTNLTEEDSGVPGVVYLSTRQGRHGRRVPWYPPRGGARGPLLTITLEDPPRILNHGVPPRDASGVVAAAEWAAQNREAPPKPWFEGTSLNRREMDAFLDGLRTLP